MVSRTITKQDANGLKAQGWKFDWSVPHQNGYEVYELLLENDDDVQGMIALKHIREQYYTHADIVEAAPDNVGRNGKYKGVGAKMIDWHTLYIDSYGAVALINKYFKAGE